MNIKRSSASRGELTKAMSATLREVRLHHDQIAAALAGIQQLMDGQAALGEAFEALKKRVDELEGHPLKPRPVLPPHWVTSKVLVVPDA